MDYVYCYLSYFGYKAAKSTMDGFWQEMSRLGKDRNPYRAAFLQFVGVAESREQAIELYTDPAEYFYCRTQHIDVRFVMPPGYVSEGTQRTGLKGQIAQVADRAKRKQAQEMREIVDHGFVVVGSPDEVAEQLRQAMTDLNVGHLMLLLHFGNMGKNLTLYNTKMFAEKVMPQLKDMFSEWENRWWPVPLESQERAEAFSFR